MTFGHIYHPLVSIFFLQVSLLPVHSLHINLSKKSCFQQQNIFNGQWINLKLMNQPVHLLFNIPMLGCFLIKYQIQITTN